MMRFLGLLLACLLAGPAMAQDGPLRLTITDGVIEPLPFAVPTFQAETAGAEQVANDISRLVAQDLTNTKLLMRPIAGSLVKAGISTAAWFTWPKAGQRITGKSVWRLWTTTARGCNF